MRHYFNIIKTDPYHPKGNFNFNYISYVSFSPEDFPQDFFHGDLWQKLSAKLKLSDPELMTCTNLIETFKLQWSLFVSSTRLPFDKPWTSYTHGLGSFFLVHISR